MIYARQPTAEEARELKRMTRREVGRVSERARMILLSTEHHPTQELATIFETTQVTVRRWIRRFNAAGPAALYDAPRSGRPRKNRQVDVPRALPSRPELPHYAVFLNAVGNDGNGDPVIVGDRA